MPDPHGMRDSCSVPAQIKRIRYRFCSATLLHGRQKTFAAAWIVLMMMCAFCSAQLPNIVVIVADDFGLGDVGRHHTERTGQAPPAPTPNLDALANDGMWFTDAHSPAALCAPSRYALMSGNYNFRSYAPGGVWNSFQQSAISPTDTTLGTIAREAGYHTGFVGKWHMGSDYYMPGTTTVARLDDSGATPSQIDLSVRAGGGAQSLGFDYDFTVMSGVQGPVYVAHENAAWYPLGAGSQLIYYDETTASDPLFVSDKGPGIGDSNWDARALNMLLADKAAAFITNHSAMPEPFFLYYCSPAVHVPHLPAATIDGEPIAGTTPTAHTDMNRVLDLEVKRIVDAVKAGGEYDNTLIIFTADNGGLEDGAAASAGHLSNGGFRGNKNRPFEGGHRVPFIAVWPDVIPAASRCDSTINGTDILATLAAITGTSYPNDQALDSHNLLRILEGDTGHEPRSELLLQAGSANELMFRQGPWKLIMSSTAGHNQLVKANTTPSHLFNLDDNPTELDSGNLVDDPAHAERVAAMYGRYWEIRHSPERTAPPFGAPTTFSPPQTIAAHAGDSRITLNWSAGVEAVSYDIFQSTTGGTFGSAIANVTGLSWTDTNVSNGFRYYYVIQSVDEGMNRSTHSVEVSAVPAALELLIDEDFSSITLGDTTGINNQITDGTYDTGLRLNNHVVGKIITNANFGTGNVLQLTTGTNPAGGYGAVSAQNNPYPVSLATGETVLLSFDMLVQELPAGTANINIELRMTGANNISRTFSEYHSATIGDIVNVSWSTTVDADMANASDISIWIPIEGRPENYSTVGPNGDGTQLDVMQLDNIKLGITPLTSGFARFEDDYGLQGGHAGDDDNDRQANVTEFAMGLNPVVPDAENGLGVRLQQFGGGNYLTLTYPRSITAQEFVQIRILRATDLSANDWQEGQTVIESVTPDGSDPDVEHVTERSTFPSDGQNQEFLKLEVTHR